MKHIVSFAIVSVAFIAIWYIWRPRPSKVPVPYPTGGTLSYYPDRTDALMADAYAGQRKMEAEMAKRRRVADAESAESMVARLKTIEPAKSKGELQVTDIFFQPPGGVYTIPGKLVIDSIDISEIILIVGASIITQDAVASALRNTTGMSEQMAAATNGLADTLDAQNKTARVMLEKWRKREKDMAQARAAELK